MNRCPITYEFCGTEKYSITGLKALSKSLKHLKNFPYTPQEQVQLASELATKLSIQGVQPKLSIVLNVSKEEFEIVEKGGKFILKPPHQIYDELPQNEDLTMRLASIARIEVPLHGMIYNADNSLSYFIKRFDRLSKNQKISAEDFSQLLQSSRETKYESSMEKIVPVIDKHCTFPLIERLKLFRLVIFNFLIGNEDMHLKNFTLICRNSKVELSPAYDLVNTTIVLKTKEEIALPIRGKKSNLTRADFVDYFGIERLRLSRATIEKEIANFKESLEPWKLLIDQSFLSQQMRTRYHELIHDRWQRICR